MADVAALMARLAETYTVGGAADAAGLGGGRNLQLQTADLLAELASRNSFVDLAISSGVSPESGFAAVALRFITASRVYLGRAGQSLLAFLAANPGKVILAGAVAGAIGVTYSWLTIEERTEIARLEQLSEILRSSFNDLPQEDRARAFASLAGSMAPQTEVSNWVYVAIAAGLGLYAWQAWQNRTD